MSQNRRHNYQNRLTDRQYGDTNICLKKRKYKIQQIILILNSDIILSVYYACYKELIELSTYSDTEITLAPDSEVKQQILVDML